MNDKPEKESKYTKDRDRYMEITKFAWDEKVNQVETLQQQNKQLIEALKQIAEYDVRDHHGYVDEWNEAASFNECKQIAESALQQIQGDEES